MMMCAPCVSRELRIFKIIIIYSFFVEFIYNEIKLEEGDWVDDDVYILYV
jgi:hypothetical protein